MITIINYGMGNLHAIRNMLAKLNIPAQITDDPNRILQAEKLILPGIGSFDAGVQNLKVNHLWQSIHESVIEKKTPILGICLGMQLMTEQSAEGHLQGFGWIKAETKKIPSSKHHRVPHIGWNHIIPVKHQDFFTYSFEELKFYFVHSYFVHCYEPRDILATVHYGETFTCAFQKNNMIGVQFHPEKSHYFGMAFLNYFALHFTHD